ncbi:hypothetical protein CCP4SC76_5180008 [Gammaproteobacteria bacterium]
METLPSLPNLDQLSVAEKDGLIREQHAQIEDLTVQIGTLTAKVSELEGRLAKNSRNSDKPPSSEGYGKPKPKSLRVVGQNKPGGQAGHAGHTLEKSEHPDHIVTHGPPMHCSCGLQLPQASLVETRQVHDLPDIGFGKAGVLVVNGIKVNFW